MQRYILQRYLRLFYPGKTIEEILLETIPKYSQYYTCILKAYIVVNTRVIAAIIGTSTGAYKKNCEKRSQVVVALLEYLYDSKRLLMYYHNNEMAGLSIKLVYNPSYRDYFNGTEI